MLPREIRLVETKSIFSPIFTSLTPFVRSAPLRTWSNECFARHERFDSTSRTESRTKLAEIEESATRTCQIFVSKFSNTSNVWAFTISSTRFRQDLPFVYKPQLYTYLTDRLIISTQIGVTFPISEKKERVFASGKFRTWENSKNTGCSKNVPLRDFCAFRSRNRLFLNKTRKYRSNAFEEQHVLKRKGFQSWRKSREAGSSNRDQGVGKRLHEIPTYSRGLRRKLREAGQTFDSRDWTLVRRTCERQTIERDA